MTLRPTALLRFYGTLLLLLCCTAISATDQLSFNHITSANGLPQNTITALLQDRHGFIWIGTYDGLHKFDGYEFKSYDTDSSNPFSISSNAITSLIEDKDGMLWVGTEQGGLNRFDPTTGKFTRYQASADDFDSLSHNKVTALHIDSQQRLWIGASNGLNMYLPDKDAFAYFENNPIESQSLPFGSVTAISESGNGDIYVATTEMLSLFDTEKQIFHRFSGPDSPRRINTIYLDEDQSLWIGTKLDGLYHLQKNSLSFRQYYKDNSREGSISSNNIRSILRDSKGSLWVGTDQGGLNLKARVSSNFTHFQKNAADIHSLSINDVRVLMEDRSGQLWIGTSGGGINKTTPHFQNFSRMQHSPFNTDSLSHNFVWNIEQDNDGNIWLATLSGIDKYNPRDNKFTHYQNFVDSRGRQINSRVTTLALDKKGWLWFGNQDGQVAKFNPNETTNNNVTVITRKRSNNKNFSQERIRLLTKDKSDNLWIATDERLALLDGDTNQIIEDFQDASVGELGDSAVHTMFEDDQGIMWFGTWDSGLQRYDPEFKKTTTFKHDSEKADSISDNTVRAIYQDEQGNLWFGTYTGLNLLRHQDRLSGNFKFKRFDEDDGLPNNTIHSITSDGSGYLWLSTNRGLSRFHPPTEEFKNFTSIDGLPADEFNGNAVLKSKDGLLYFGSVSGVAVIDPGGIVVSEYQPPLVLTQLRINSEPLFKNDWRELKEINLEHDENSLQFNFSALDLRLPQRNQYAYRLIPLNSQWQLLSGKNQVQYGNLRSGEYQFEVRSTNSDGIWFDQVMRVNVNIAPPIWASWWAYACYLIFTFGLIRWFISNHNKKLREQQKLNEHLQRVDRLKDEFLANTSHELRTPLNGIIGVAESLREGIAGSLNDKTQHNLSLIIDSAKRLSHQVDEILDFKKLRHHGLILNRRAVDLRVAANVAINLLKPLAEDKSLRLTNSLPRFLPPVYADENRLRQILYNLIGNAIKYTNEGFVEVTARVIENNVELCVKDSGVGIEKQKQAVIFKPFEQLDESHFNVKAGTGLGLTVSRQLIDLHQGKIWLKSKVGSGSSFYVTFPMVSENQAEPTVQTIVNESLPAPQSNHSPAADDYDQSTLSENEWQPHILVVDDDRLNRQVLNDFLIMRNYRVTEAIDGLQALEMVEHHTFDLVILDVMMPRLSGFEVCEKIRKDFSALELPILLLSAKSQPDDIDTGLSSGANDYVSKPVDRTVLLARVSTLLMLRQVFQSQQKHLQYLAMEQTFNQLSRYFPRPLIERILDNKQSIHMHPERRCITVLFADIVGFTEFSDRFEPETVTDVFNEFLSRMGDKITQHNGLLNEVLGDGLVILFGALEHLEKATQAKEAVQLAKDMQLEIDELAEQWRASGLEQSLTLRIGIHQSYVTLGNFGSKEMIVFRAIGSGVNLASRIQGTCLPREVKVSYPIYAQARDEFEFVPQDAMKFKGFNHSHRIFLLQ